MQQKRVDFHENWDEKNKRYNCVLSLRLFISELLTTAGRLLHIAFLKVMLLPHFEDILVFSFQVWFHDLCCIRTR